MIVHAFEDTLDKGLQKDGQVVVRLPVYAKPPMIIMPILSTADE